MNPDRKRSSSPPRSSQPKRLTQVDDTRDRRHAPKSSNAPTSFRGTTSSHATGKDPQQEPEESSGYLADFIAEYQLTSPPISPALQPNPAPVQRNLAAGRRGTAISPPGGFPTPENDAYQGDRSGTGGARNEEPGSAGEGDDSSSDESMTTDDEGSAGDEEMASPRAEGSDVELQDGLVRVGMQLTVVLRGADSALPCTAEVLRVLDRRGRMTIRLSKASRRAVRMWLGAVESPGAA